MKLNEIRSGTLTYPKNSPVIKQQEPLLSLLPDKLELSAKPSFTSHVCPFARCFAPQGSITKQILGKISDLSVFLKVKEISPRSEDGLVADLGFQKEVQKLVDSNVITPTSLVISDTGHDIPVFAQILENPDLKAKGAFHLPHFAKKGFLKRLPAQAEMWAEKIIHAEKANANEKGTLFIGLETHRIPPEKKGPLSPYDLEVDPQTLPSSESLKEYGIDRIVYMKEAPPKAYSDISTFVKFDIKDYIENLQTQGLEVVCYGIDPRRVRS